MGDLFESYEEEFHEIRQSIEVKIRNIPTLQGVDRRAETQRAEGEIKELDQVVRQMNLSGRSNTKLNAKIKEYENEIIRLRSNVRKADMQIGQTNDRGELFSGFRADDIMAPSMGQRDRLIANNDRLEKSSYELQNAVSTATETVGVGIQILTDLDEQTEKMRGMRTTLSDIEGSLNKAKKLMKIIGRRAVANKLILIVIALVLVAAICIVVYIRFFWYSKSDDNNTGSTTTTTIDGTSGYMTTLGLRLSTGSGGTTL